MREIRPYGSEGGGSLDLPTPIETCGSTAHRFSSGLQQLFCIPMIRAFARETLQRNVSTLGFFTLT